MEIILSALDNIELSYLDEYIINDSMLSSEYLIKLGKDNESDFPKKVYNFYIDNLKLNN